MLATPFHALRAPGAAPLVGTWSSHRHRFLLLVSTILRQPKVQLILTSWSPLVRSALVATGATVDRRPSPITVRPSSAPSSSPHHLGGSPTRYLAWRLSLALLMFTPPIPLPGHHWRALAACATAAAQCEATMPRPRLAMPTGMDRSGHFWRRAGPSGQAARFERCGRGLKAGLLLFIGFSFSQKWLSN
jgi:hypothetical protein